MSTSAMRASDRHFRIPQRLVDAALIYVALSAVIPQYVAVEAGPLSLGLMLSGVLALIGFRTLRSLDDKRTYMTWAALLGFWAIISAVNSGTSASGREVLTFVLWLVFLIPGMAALLTLGRNRQAFVLGWSAGVAVYVVSATFRLLSGREVLDEEARPGVALLLGDNRNAVNMLVLVALPYLLTGDGGKLFRFCRWPVAAMSGVWVVHSGGRAGILGLALVLGVLAVVQPGISRRLQQGLVVGIVGVLAFTAIQDAGGDVSASTDRLTSFLQGERTDADESRELLLRKAWHLTFEHPAFGIGFGRFEETYHPVVEEADTLRAKQIAEDYQEHNTFAGFMAEMGFPGLFAFLGVSTVLLLRALRRIRDRAGRAAVASYAGLLLGIFFQTTNGPRLFLPMMLTFAAGWAGTSRDPGDNGTSVGSPDLIRSTDRGSVV